MGSGVNTDVYGMPEGQQLEEVAVSSASDTSSGSLERYHSYDLQFGFQQTTVGEGSASELRADGTVYGTFNLLFRTQQGVKFETKDGYFAPAIFYDVNIPVAKFPGYSQGELMDSAYFAFGTSMTVGFEEGVASMDVLTGIRTKAESDPSFSPIFGFMMNAPLQFIHTLPTVTGKLTWGLGGMYDMHHDLSITTGFHFRP